MAKVTGHWNFRTAASVGVVLAKSKSICGYVRARACESVRRVLASVCADAFFLVRATSPLVLEREERGTEREMKNGESKLARSTLRLTNFLKNKIFNGHQPTTSIHSI